MPLEQNEETTLAYVAARYLATAPGTDRANAQQEVNRFVRWCGGDRRLSDLRPHEIELYADSFTASSPDAATRLEPLKAFFRCLKKQGLTTENLGAHLKVKRTGASRRNHQKKVGIEVERLTAEGFAKMQAEMEELKARRVHIAEDLKRAMADKDFSENAPLDAAREYQGQVEARIRELEQKLGSATILRKNHGESSQRIRFGCRVTVQDLASGDQFTYVLVSPSEANPRNGSISIVSPTGRALLGRGPGDEVEVVAPAGTLRYRIEKVEA